MHWHQNKNARLPKDHSPTSFGNPAILAGFFGNLAVPSRTRGFPAPDYSECGFIEKVIQLSVEVCLMGGELVKGENGRWASVGWSRPRHRATAFGRPSTPPSGHGHGRGGRVVRVGGMSPHMGRGVRVPPRQDGVGLHKDLAVAWSIRLGVRLQREDELIRANEPRFIHGLPHDRVAHTGEILLPKERLHL
jgi:hypothetical protein